MYELKLNVLGMVCEGCEKRVVNSISILDGIKEVIANHKEGIVIVKTNEEIDKAVIKEMITDLGFEVKED